MDNPAAGERDMEFESKTDEELKRKGGTKGGGKLLQSESCIQLFGGGLHGIKVDKDEYDRHLKKFYEPYMLKSVQKMSTKSDQVSGKGQYSKPKPSCSQTTSKFDNQENIILNSDIEVKSRDFFSRRKAHIPPQQPLTKPLPRLVDEDDDQEKEPLVWKPFAQELIKCIQDVNHKDVARLEPGHWLSSGIMNFYIGYLQLTSTSENMIHNSHFFTTFFYVKLQQKYEKDAFRKLRKWWKNVNLFEKAYIFVPIFESNHWSLAIICNPPKEDELGPIILHLDSLKLHNSSLIFKNLRRFLKTEWSCLQTSELHDNRIIGKSPEVPQQKDETDCGLFVLFYMERFLKEAPERLTEKDLSMFTKQWFCPEEASNLRRSIHDLIEAITKENSL